MDRVLVAEISGKRPGTKKQRPTERFDIDYDHLIISNNSDGYETEWPVVMVPDDYVQWYKDNVKTSDNAWYAPMNRSYAIKYAREHGYKYLIQLDDNITKLEIAYIIKDSDDIIRRYRAVNKPGMINDYIDMLCCVLENTNAGMVGCQLNGTTVPDDSFLKERYVYSIFAINVDVCPDIFHGDFEDDIEYKLKMNEMGIPVVMVCPLRYSKTGQKSAKDETGNRAAYTEAGLKRGEHMRQLHGDVYSCGYSGKIASVTSKNDGRYFKHKLKPVKVGVVFKNRQAVEDKMAYIFSRYAVDHDDKVIIKEKGGDRDCKPEEGWEENGSSRQRV